MPVGALLLVALGCKGGDDDLAPAVQPKTYTFQGKVDDKFAGTWKSSDGSTTLGLAKDGGLSIDTVSRSVAGKATSHQTGKWLTTGDSLLFQYKRGTGDQTLKYDATLQGSKMTLQQPGSRSKTVYQRS